MKSSSINSGLLIVIMLSMACSPAATQVSPESPLLGPRRELVKSPAGGTSGSEGGTGGITSTGSTNSSEGSDVPPKAPVVGAGGQPPAPMTPPGRVSPLELGDVVPFPGVLFSPEAVAWILAQQEGHVERIRIERQDAMARADAGCDRRVSDLETRSRADKATMQVQLESQQRIIEIYRRQIEDLEKNGTGPSPIIWGGLGGVVGVLVTLSIIFAVNSASN